MNAGSAPDLMAVEGAFGADIDYVGAHYPAERSEPGGDGRRGDQPPASVTSSGWLFGTISATGSSTPNNSLVLRWAVSGRCNRYRSIGRPPTKRQDQFGA